MTDAELRDAVVGMRHWSPWTVCGTPDPDVTEPEGASHHALLTGPELLTCFRRAFPEPGGCRTVQLALDAEVAPVSDRDRERHQRARQAEIVEGERPPTRHAPLRAPRPRPSTACPVNACPTSSCSSRAIRTR